MPPVFLPTSTQNVPVNQINALPLLSISQYIAGDGADTLIYAKRTLKYWSPTALGIDGVVPILTPPKTHITTPWLNVSPCQFFALTVLRNVLPGTLVGSDFITSIMQYKQTPTDNPLLTYPDLLSTNDAYNGMPFLETTSFKFPFVPAPDVQRYQLLYSPNTGVGSTIQNVALMIGPFIRFQLSWGTGHPDPIFDFSTYSLSILGSS
jgi:hypothetical protein